MSASTSAPDRETAEDTLAKLGRQIAGARVQRSMSQDDVGALAGTSRARISEIENAKIFPRSDTLVRVAHAVGLELTLTPRD